MRHNLTDEIADALSDIPFGADRDHLVEAVSKIADVLEIECQLRQEPFDKRRFIVKGCSVGFA